MSVEILTLPVNIGKTITLVLGLLILIIGLHSHFQSTWTKTIGNPPQEYKGYEICNSNEIQIEAEIRERRCPAISLERYFVTITIICSFLSLTGYISGYFVDLQKHPYRLTDLIFHCASSLLLLIASVVYLVSAAQIDESLFHGVPVGEDPTEQVNLRKSEKIAAACLTIIQAYAYGVVATLIAVT